MAPPHLPLALGKTKCPVQQGLEQRNTYPPRRRRSSVLLKQTSGPLGVQRRRSAIWGSPLDTMVVSAGGCLVS